MNRERLVIIESLELDEREVVIREPANDTGPRLLGPMPDWRGTGPARGAFEGAASCYCKPGICLDPERCPHTVEYIPPEQSAA